MEYTEENASDEDEEFAWRRMCDLFGLKTAGKEKVILLSYY
jgi:hypothetical protein